LPAPAYAHRPEDGKVYAAFGPFLFQTQRFEEQFQSPITGGWGLIAEGDLNKYGGLELSVFSMNQIFALERQDKKIIEKVTRLFIAMGWRQWLGRDFSLSPSFFSSYVMGDAKIIRSEFPANDPPRTSARDPVDYGVGLSAQLEALHLERFAIVIDARYNYSLTPKRGEDMNTYGFFVGFKYFIQGKQPDEAEEM